MDALSWALYRNGQYEQALEANAKALRLGTRDALFYYHAGLIQQKLRHPEQAADDLHTAFRINPSFDLIRAEEARSVLSAIEQGPSSEPSR